MKRKTDYVKTLLCFYAITLSLVSCHSTQKIPFKKKDVASAQRLIGIDFTENQLDTMHLYLERNLNGYDSLRKYPIENEVFPALLFDPLPREFVFAQSEIKNKWPIPSDVELPENKEEIAFYNILQLASLIKNRKITSEEVTRIYLNRLKKYNFLLKCVVSFTEDLAFQQARKADREIEAGKYRGPLHGIPYGVKDLMAVEGYRTTWGAVPYQHQTIEYTATVVRKLEDAGAVLIAKLTTGSLAKGDVWFGGKTKNPWDLNQGASGSSAGSGSATAAGLVAFALGTETLGSIVSPSNRCGVTGLRPTYGRVSRYGVMSLAWSMDKVGPICRNAEDCAIVFDAIQGPDDQDPTLIDAPFHYDTNQDPRQLRIGYLAGLFVADTSKAKSNRLEALAVFREMGIRLDSVDLPKTLPHIAYDIILRAESGAFFDELVRSGQVDQMIQQDQRSRANSLRQSRFIPAVEYLQANRHRRLLIENMHHLMKNYDVILAPTFSGPQLMITNLTGHPALAIPTGLDARGHPTSITLIGNLFDEGTILALGKAFQAYTSYEESHPPQFKP